MLKHLKSQRAGCVSVLVCSVKSQCIIIGRCVFSTLDDNQGGGDSQSVSETAHKLLPLSQSEHKPTPCPDKSPATGSAAFRSAERRRRST